jgi:hypothetical protein
MQTVIDPLIYPGMRIPKDVADYLKRVSQRHGRKGGLKRASRLTPERRSEIARAAAKARWAKKDGKQVP